MAQETRSLSSEAVLRPPGGEVYAFGPVRIDVVRHLVTRDGQPIALAPKTFELLLILVRSGGRAISRPDLLAALWSDTFVEEANLSFQVSALRKALGDGAEQWIETVPKVGYRFTPEVTAEPTRVEAAREAGRNVDGGTRETGSRFSEALAGRRRLAIAAAVIVGASALAIASWSVRNGLVRDTPTQPVTSLAVLPFTNGTGDPGVDHISEGLTASVIHRISRLAGLRVISQTSVQFLVKKHGADPQAIARDLGVDSVLTGRLVKHPAGFALGLELIDARDNRLLWGQGYEVDPRDVAKLERVILMDFVEQLRLPLSAASQEQLTIRDTDDAEAYQLYLKGRSALLKSRAARPLGAILRDLTAANAPAFQHATKAAVYFEAASARDPAYAQAYAGLAESYLYSWLAGQYWPELTRGQKRGSTFHVVTRGRTAAEKAVSLDGDLPEAYLTLGLIKWTNWDFAQASFAIGHAIRANPNSAEAHHIYSHLLQELGRIDDAFRESQTFLELDPVSAVPVVHHAGLLSWARRYDDAIAWHLKARQIDPDVVSWNLCDAYYGKGLFEKAAECIVERDKRVLTPTQIGDLRSAFARDGIEGLFRVRIGQLKAVTDQNHGNVVDIAALYARLGETEEVFRHLERAYAMRAQGIAAVRADVRFDNVRHDPRFADILRRIGLPALPLPPAATTGKTPQPTDLRR